jgi:glycyl-tRNA synthetase (class II)
VEQYLEWFGSLGISRENLFLYEVPEGDLAHYSKRTVDVMYRYFPEREKPWEELMGIAWRTDFDLSTHSKNKLDAEGETHQRRFHRGSVVFRRANQAEGFIRTSSNLRSVSTARCWRS